ncbi:tRNA(Ile)-lysidine synthase [Balnearium lithotrophicum]|uniref:tRNA(Ile)-lysidine synthase n=1 Tax=Balnearium lithotrophicum TaxID=223788 RepID=A0A521C8N3_9BACT|nr:tRNA lysidine(34) synthetase TilS [Balnearium lithotrophicum]SMO55080.1 tRNA(Ile)-lysidine synthase [Balnearium lithotrophicum]
MENLRDKVLKTIDKFSLIHKGSKVLVALSGGPDSVTLLHLLNQLKDRLSVEVAAVHVNHMLRGEESERDEQFVRELCRSWKVPLFVERVNVPGISKGKNVEAVARRERYRKFKEVLESWKGDLVALGHTASDLTETVLLNLTRGTGLKGLRGFLPKRDVFIRPLFEVKREEVENYIRENKIPFVVDSSNLETKYERNLLRIEIVPILKKINPSLEDAILRETEILREIEDFVSSEVKNLVSAYLKKEKFCIPISTVKQIHPFLFSEVLREAYRRISTKELSFEKVQLVRKILEKEGYREIFPHRGFKIYKEQEFFCIEKEGKFEKFSFKVDNLPTTVETPLYRLSFYKNRGIPILTVREFEKNGLIVRSRLPGDRLMFKDFSKKLKKFLIEKRVPFSIRDKIPIVETSGRIIFIPNLYARRVNSPEFIGVEFEEKAESSNSRGEDSKES